MTTPTEVRQCRRSFLKRGMTLADGFAMTLAARGGTLAGESTRKPSPSGADSLQRTYFVLATMRDDQDNAYLRHTANKMCGFFSRSTA